MEANDLFCFASFQFRQKYEKTLFQFNGIWVMVLVENHIFPHPPNADLCLLARKRQGLFDLFNFYFILFCLIFFIFIYLFVILFVCLLFFFFCCLFFILFYFIFILFYFILFYFIFFLRQKKGIHEGDT